MVAGVLFFMLRCAFRFELRSTAQIWAARSSQAAPNMDVVR